MKFYFTLGPEEKIKIDQIIYKFFAIDLKILIIVHNYTKLSCKTKPMHMFLSHK